MKQPMSKEDVLNSESEEQVYTIVCMQSVVIKIQYLQIVSVNHWSIEMDAYTAKRIYCNL